MKKLIIYMVKYKDGSFGIKNDIFEKPVTEENIQLFLAEKKEDAIKVTKERYPHISHVISDKRYYFLSITTLED